MELIIRLYRPHDDDLMAVYQKTGGRQMNLYIKDALSAYVNNESAKYRFPDIVNAEFNDSKKSVRLHLNINDNMYEKEISVLKGMNDSFRQIFIKTLLRTYHFNELISLYGTGIKIPSGNDQNVVNASMVNALLASLSSVKIDDKPAQKKKSTSKPKETLEKEQAEPVPEVNEKELIQQKTEADMDTLANMFGL